MTLTDRIRSSFSKIFDAAQPSSTEELRRRVLSATQRENIQAIIADWQLLGRMRDDYALPSKRLAVLVWLHAGPGKTIDDLPRDVRIDVEQAAIEGNQRAILHQDELIAERSGPIVARAKAAVADAHATLLPHLLDELAKVRALLGPVYEKYNCEHELGEAGPVRRILRSIDDSERVSRGEFAFAAGHIEGELGLWL